MGECAIGDPAGFIESKFGVHLKQVGNGEWAGPCPWCGGTDRFHIWQEGNFWCRPAPDHCSREGWIDELEDTKHRLSKLERRMLTIEREQAKARREREKQEKRITAIERMRRCTDHLRYYQQMNDAGFRDFWHEKGVGDHLIDQYQLGICYHCKTDQPGERMSLTVPVINGGKLVNIRHRLIGGDLGDKYRPHRAGLGNTLFGADDVYGKDTSSILIIEGEIKRIVVKDRVGGNVVGTMGKAGFQRSWARRFGRFDEILIALDPDAADKAREMASWFGERARVARIPVKPDDFFTIYGGTVADFEWFLRLARKHHATN